MARISSICPDNTIHGAMGYIEPRSPLPWLHIAEVVAAQAVQRGFSRLGLTGTRWLVESEVYPDKLSARGLQYVRPEPGRAGRDQPHHHGRARLRRLQAGGGRLSSSGVIGRMKDEGCDAVVLGCTEIP